MENFKQPIFNFCRRIGKKFLSNIGVSSKQISFLKNFSIKFYYFLLVYPIFYTLIISKFSFLNKYCFTPQKFFLPKSYMKISNTRFLKFVALKMLNFCNKNVTIILQKCYKIVTYAFVTPRGIRPGRKLYKILFAFF